MNGDLSRALILLLHALVFVVEAIIGAIGVRALHKALKVVFIEVGGADVRLIIIVVIVIHTGLAVGNMLFCRFCHDRAFFHLLFIIIIAECR